MTVVIVGGGPTGLFTGIVLTTYGVETIVLEKSADIRRHGGATHLHSETCQSLLKFGLREFVEQSTLPKSQFYLYKAKIKTPSNDLGDVVFPIPQMAKNGPFAGLAAENLIYQGDLEAALLARASELGVRVEFGQEVVSLEDDNEHVLVRTQQGMKLRASYIIGADGAKSFVREHYIKSDFEEFDSGSKRLFFILDLIAKRDIFAEQKDPSESWAMLDPARPVSFFRMPNQRFRLAFWLKEGEDSDSFQDDKKVEAFVEDELAPIWANQLRRGVDYEIDRPAAYWVRHRKVKEMRKNRCFLIGDAAQVMGPFMGQGLCQGIRASFNLCFKLALVVKAKASPSLLDTFETEMQPFSRRMVQVTAMSLYVNQTRSPFVAALRDWILAPFLKYVVAAKVLEPAQPYIANDLTDADLGAGGLWWTKPSSKATGKVFVQPWVLPTHSVLDKSETDGDSKQELVKICDCLDTSKFVVVTFDNFNALAHLDEAQLQFLQRDLRASFVRLVTAGKKLEEKADAETVLYEAHYGGRYVLPKWRDLHGSPSALIVRPDGYIFASVSVGGDLQSAVQHLITSLQVA